MMDTLVLLLLLSTSVTSIPTTECNRLRIRDKYYDREILWANNVGRPYNLNVHKPSNTLFFSFSTPETYSDIDFTLAFYNIDTQEYRVVAGVRGGCATAIDPSSDDIYMGGSDGIFKFNMNTKIADFYKEKNKNIWALYFRKNLFYITYPDQKLHIEIDDRFALVKEFENFQIDHFFVSVLNEIFFANDSGLFKYDAVATKVIVINELILVRHIVDDDDGNIYICTNFGIFIYSNYDGLKKILDYKYIFGLTFDRDNNFIIADGNSLWRLKYSEKGCESDEFHW